MDKALSAIEEQIAKYELLATQKTKKQSEYLEVSEQLRNVVKNCNLQNVNNRLIDNVTVTNLDLAFRMVGISCDRETVDRIIDLVELIESKGDDTSMKNVIDLQAKW